VVTEMRYRARRLAVSKIEAQARLR
jgi:hypothetical protein